MELLIRFLTVVGIGAVELWAAIPAGLAFRLPPVLTGIASALGAIGGAILVIVLGDRARTWILNIRGGKGSRKKNGVLYRIWNRYGVIGLGLLAPLITGAPLGAAIGITLGASPRQLFLWISLGIVVWTIILTVLAVLGVMGIEAVENGNTGGGRPFEGP
ncbi:small multi-drug export protein [Calditerricola satsumensis]|uniref:Small multi-drug export protein n=1 Tax=Calditerricola satsumensis TaxID=373054 RepID=A0A8J3FBX8_9BACI|nr:small multi-drug export protein [Calditerricola satsumensis]GGK06634.1 hypothetical protein GCM10007043_20890 [Calditerricola satsumensis]